MSDQDLVPRRLFLAFSALAGLGAAFGIESPSQHQGIDRQASADHILNVAKTLHYVPENLRDHTLWRYKPLLEVSDTTPMGGQNIIQAENMLRMIREANPLEDRAVTIDHPVLPVDLHYTGVGLVQDSSRRSLRDVTQQIEGLKEQLAGMDYRNRFANTAAILANSLRNVNFQLDDRHHHYQQTLGQLLRSNHGACEDFAMARYMLARALGTPEDDLMIVIYCNHANPKAYGHVNLAMYDREASDWVFVDGTGRSPKERMGQAIAYTNSQDAFDRLKPFAELTPVLTVGHKGLCIIDSIETSLPDGYIFKAPLALPRTEAPSVLTYLAPEPRMQPFLGRLFTRRPA